MSDNQQARPRDDQEARLRTTLQFRRLVLELGHGGADPATMRQAAVFARLLNAELHALFVEDETLLHASQFPFAREISSLSGQWRPLAPDRLRDELRAAADQARRGFTEAAEASGVRRHFEVGRGDLGVLVTEVCVASDIVVVPFARGMGGETAHGFRRLRETACRSCASVLFLPPRSGPDRGSVVAVAAAASDPSVAMAHLIADRGREPVLVVAPMGVEAGERVLRLPAGHSPQDIAAVLGQTRERLIVMTRGDGDSAAAALAVLRGVPVLMIEPDCDLADPAVSR
jgi:hypothetical protein